MISIKQQRENVRSMMLDWVRIRRLCGEDSRQAEAMFVAWVASSNALSELEAINEND